MKKISAIICAYNEASTIKDVITTVSDYFFDEVIVVNDGSTDKTDEILKKINKDYIFKYIVLPENKGKGYAMATGIENANGEIIVFIDADLSNLKEEHFFQLLSPILKNEADMVLGQATETLINYSVNPFKSLTGERALRKKDILPILDKIKHSRFGVETLINIYYQSQGKKIKYVMLNKLKHPTKFQKTTPINATKEFLIAGQEIAITVLNNYDLILKIIKKSISKNIKI
ncbi:MAG: glycosyltransferase family 2 protein [Bacteroidales bacterium]|nr:glycosyltransferase family 2 protein [Bacteroidales bacterium]